MSNVLSPATPALVQMRVSGASEEAFEQDYRTTIVKRPESFSDYLKEQVVMSGALEKLASSFFISPQWQARYWQLRGFYLVYYAASRRAAPASSPLGIIDLRCVVQVSVDDGQVLVLKSKSRELKLRIQASKGSPTEGPDEPVLLLTASLHDWRTAIEAAISSSRVHESRARHDVTIDNSHLGPQTTNFQSSALSREPWHELDSAMKPLSFRRALEVVAVLESPSSCSYIVRIFITIILVLGMFSANVRTQSMLLVIGA